MLCCCFKIPTFFLIKRKKRNLQMLLGHPADEFGAAESKPCGLFALECSGPGGGLRPADPPCASQEGAQPEMEESHTVHLALPVPFIPMVRGGPGNTSVLSMTCLEGQGTLQWYDNLTEPCKHPVVLVKVASASGDTGSSPTLSSVVCGVKA